MRHDACLLKRKTRNDLRHIGAVRARRCGVFSMKMRKSSRRYCFKPTTKHGLGRCQCGSIARAVDARRINLRAVFRCPRIGKIKALDHRALVIDHRHMISLTHHMVRRNRLRIHEDLNTIPTESPQFPAMRLSIARGACVRWTLRNGGRRDDGHLLWLGGRPFRGGSELIRWRRGCARSTRLPRNRRCARCFGAVSGQRRLSRLLGACAAGECEGDAAR